MLWWKVMNVLVGGFPEGDVRGKDYASGMWRVENSAQETRCTFSGETFPGENSRARQEIGENRLFFNLEYHKLVEKSECAPCDGARSLWRERGEEKVRPTRKKKFLGQENLAAFLTKGGLAG
jgi:hypothetical protein